MLAPYVKNWIAENSANTLYHNYIIAYIIEFKGVKVPVLHQIYNLWLHDARSKSTIKTWKTLDKYILQKYQAVMCTLQPCTIVELSKQHKVNSVGL